MHQAATGRLRSAGSLRDRRPADPSASGGKARNEPTKARLIKIYLAWKPSEEGLVVSALCCVVCIFGALTLALTLALSVFSARTGLMARFAAAEGVDTDEWNSWPTAERLRDHHFWLYCSSRPSSTGCSFRCSTGPSRG
jgi:hypothetical protein